MTGVALRLLAAGVLAAAGLPSPTRAAPAGQPSEPATSRRAAATIHRIGVRVVDGAGELFDTATGERFVARGANLVRLADGHHSTLSVGHYEPASSDAALADLAAAGYNVVRVFLDTFAGGLPGAGQATPLSDAYLDNMTDLLARAAGHGVSVIFTLDWLPESSAYAFDSDPGIEHVNSLYLSRGGVAASARFFGDLARGLVERGARLDALLAYELRNELYFSELYPPFSLQAGRVSAANGRTYDTASPDDRVRMLEEGLVHWVDTMRDAILAADPSALVAVGFFQPKGPNASRAGDDRIIETAAVIRDSSVDLIDLHAYPGGELDLRQIVENFGLPRTTAKPVLLGEFGADRVAFPESDDAVRALVEWQIESCRYGFDGWLVWTWDSLEQPEFWNAQDADGAIAQALSPLARPDPCAVEPLALQRELARGATARATSALSDQPARAAIDGLTETVWNAGDSAPQAITIDLGSPRSIDRLRLLVAQYPAGRSRHEVAVRGPRGGWRQVAVLDAPTSDGDWLVVEPRRSLRRVRFVRIATTSIEGGSWVAWREVSILGR